MPYLGYQTYYRIVGERKDNGKAPLICLHGGPGSTHNYFEVLDNVADDDDRMIVMYDQIGCGNSYLDGHPELWNQKVWLDELEALRKHLDLDVCHIIGQSWGGMMQIAYAVDYDPKGVKSFIISSGHPSSSLWEREGLRRIKMMPQDMQDAINHALETGDFTGELTMLQLQNTWIDIATTGLEKMLRSAVQDRKNQVLSLMLKDGDQTNSHLQEH